MIPKESFFRSHFFIKKGVWYRPLIELENEIELSFQWGEEALFFTFEEKCRLPFCLSWPKYQAKDALVLFLDTRPKKKAHSLHKASYALLCLPEAVEGVQSKEITKFHGLESRALVKDNSLSIHVENGKKKRTYEIGVPQEILYGFEEDTDEISFAFSYFSSALSQPLHFPIPTVLPERVPYVWPICHCTRG